MAETILLTGFAPFGDFRANPSQAVVERLDGQTIDGARIVGLTLPVVFGEDTARVLPLLAELRPRLVLSLGLAAGIPCLDVERFAVNRRVAGKWSSTEPLGANRLQSAIIDDGPAAYFATVDAEQVGQSICERAHVPARAHSDAGTYLCNHIFYQIRHWAEQNDPQVRVGFIHLPLSSEQAIQENRGHLPSLPLDSIIAGVRTAIESILNSIN